MKSDFTPTAWPEQECPEHAVNCMKCELCLGNTSVQWFFGSKDAEVKKLRGTWYNVRGLAAYVSYHPLAVRRRPNLLYQFTLDWEKFASRFFQERELMRNE